MRASAPTAFLLTCGVVAAPLTVFDQADLAGPGVPLAETFTVYEGAGIPEGLEDRISSFRLEAGHLLVVAAQASGLGPGRTYIAAEEALEVRNLPEDLDDALSFLRVVPWKPTLKKGTGGDLSAQPDVGASWYYTWGYSLTRGQTAEAREYVPMSWGAGGAEDTVIPRYRAMDQVTSLLGFNESDNCEDQSGQYRNLCDVPTAVGFFRNLQKAGLRLGSPAPREGGAQSDTSWLSRFIDQSEAADVRIDFVALHWYDWGSNPAAHPNAPASEIFLRFKTYLSNAYHRYRRPLWITEFNANIHRPTATQDAFLELALPYLEALGYVERYAWFQPSTGTGDFFADGQLTTTGEIYRAQASRLAYAAEALPAPWQSHDIGPGTTAGASLQARGTFTVGGSGVGIGGNADGFQFTHSPLAGDGELVARLDALLPRSRSKAGLMMRESLAPGARHAALYLSQSGETRFETRGADGGATEVTTGPVTGTPVWLKLERVGDEIAGYTSADGASWTLLARRSVPLPAALHRGLAVSAQSVSTYCDALFFLPDADLDGLDDAWERAFFGNLGGSAGGGDDFDGDAATDREEFLFGTDPTDPASFFAPLIRQAESGHLELSFDGVAHRRYFLDVSETMEAGSWTTVDNVTPLVDGPQTLRHPAAAGAPALFGRIRVER